MALMCWLKGGGSSCGSFMVDTGILSNNISFPHTNVKWHSVTWPYTMTTPYWSDFIPNSTFYRILSGFHRTFATGVACRQGTLTPPDTWSRPFGTCICSTCWDQSFSELVVILPDYALRISLQLLLKIRACSCIEHQFIFFYMLNM